jgi:hypothetical protein
MENRMESCSPIPSLEELLNRDNYVEVEPMELIQDEKVIYYHPEVNYISCVKIIKIDNENITIMHNEGNINQSTDERPIKLLDCKFFRKNFDKKNYNNIIAPLSAPLSKKRELPEGAPRKVLENEDLNSLIGSFLGGRHRRKSKTTKRRRMIKSRKNKRNTKRRTR